jgi:hypothetical protein
MRWLGDQEFESYLLSIVLLRNEFKINRTEYLVISQTRRKVFWSD